MKVFRTALILVILPQVAFPRDYRTLTLGELLGRGITQPTALQKVPTACDTALQKCQEVVQVQDQYIKQLKSDQKKLEDAVYAEKRPLLPTWAWMLLAGLTGAVVGAKVLGR